MQKSIKAAAASAAVSQKIITNERNSCGSRQQGKAAKESRTMIVGRPLLAADARSTCAPCRHGSACAHAESLRPKTAIAELQLLVVRQPALTNFAFLLAWSVDSHYTSTSFLFWISTAACSSPPNLYSYGYSCPSAAGAEAAPYNRSRYRQTDTCHLWQIAKLYSISIAIDIRLYLPLSTTY